MTASRPELSTDRIVPFKGIKVIAFDADDTLWDCQSHFAAAERRYCALLEQYGTEAEVSAALFRTETSNMPLLGYGCKAFTLSLVENAVAVSGGRVGGSVIGEIVGLGKGLLNIPATPLPGVEHTLVAFHAEGRYRLVVFTKGELLDRGEQAAPFRPPAVLQSCGNSVRQDADGLSVALPQHENQSVEPPYGGQLVQERRRAGS